MQPSERRPRTPPGSDWPHMQPRHTGKLLSPFPGKLTLSLAGAGFSPVRVSPPAWSPWPSGPLRCSLAPARGAQQSGGHPSPDSGGAHECGSGTRRAVPRVGALPRRLAFLSRPASASPFGSSCPSPLCAVAAWRGASPGCRRRGADSTGTPFIMFGFGFVIFFFFWPSKVDAF